MFHATALSSGPLAATLIELGKAARAAVISPLKRGAMVLLAEPWRLELIVPGANDTEPELVENLVRSQKEIMRDLGRRGHHAYDANRMLALRQAYLAVRLARLRQRLTQLAPRKIPAQRQSQVMSERLARPQRAIDLSADNYLPSLLEERQCIRQSLAQAKARLAEIEAYVRDRLGSHSHATLPGWRISHETRMRAGYAVAPSLIRSLTVTPDLDPLVRVP